MIDRRFMVAKRRRRFVVAASEIAHEFGRQGITATSLCQVAGTARGAFYGVFANVDDCLRHAAGEIEAELFAPVKSVHPGDDWLPEVERAIAGLYSEVAAEPLSAEFLFVHSFALGEALLMDSLTRAPRSRNQWVGTYFVGAQASERLLGLA